MIKTRFRSIRSSATALSSRKSSWISCLLLVLVTPILASIAISGWPQGLIPTIRVPYLFAGDGLSHAWLIQRTIESTWYFNNHRSGYPFGSSFLDYPSSDFGNFAVIKIIGSVFGTWYATLNIYFLLGFAVTGATTLVVLRSFKLNNVYAVCGALIFTFLPYHFLRLAHLFYTWYFVVPVYFYYAYRIFCTPGTVTLGSLLRNRRTYIHALVLIFCSCFGVYFAAFGCIVLCTAGAVSALNHRKVLALAAGVCCALVIALGVGINITPNLLYTMKNGTNPEVAVRSPAESEIYGLKIDQMLLPRENHRVAKLAEITAEYEKTFPLVNENSTATLGFFGSIGFLILLGAGLCSLAGIKLDRRIALISAITMTLLLIATVGGFSSLFALFVSASIRGWNRISVFIAFPSILAVLIYLDYLSRVKARFFTPTAASCLLILSTVLALFDQISPACRTCAADRAARFHVQMNFFQEVEKALPNGSAVYQLPYISFPEVPDVFGVSSYDELKGFLFSKNLRWSHGGMKGRAGDAFYRALSKMSLPNQIAVVKSLGFSGITLNTAGFSDQGKEEEKTLTSIIGAPEVKSADGRIYFYRLHGSQPEIELGAPPEKVALRAQAVVKNLDSQYLLASFRSGLTVDFSSADLENLSGISGLSGEESWGRWSDAHLADHVTITFKGLLPSHFILHVTAIAYGPNVGKRVVIRAGRAIKSLTFGSSLSTQSATFDTVVPSNKIEIYPPQPVSPNGDPRLIGIGIQKINVKQSE